MCGSMVDIRSPTAEIRRGKKRRKKEENRSNHRMKILEMWANAQPDGRPAEHSALCSTPQSLADAHY